MAKMEEIKFKKRGLRVEISRGTDEQYHVSLIHSGRVTVVKHFPVRDSLQAFGCIEQWLREGSYSTIQT